MHDYNIKLAKVAVNYSVKVKPGDNVVIQGYTLSEDLMKALYVEILKAGGHPRIMASIPGVGELFFKYANDDQLMYIDEISKKMNETLNCMIYIQDEYNPYKFESVNPSKMQMRMKNPDLPEMMRIRKERELSGDFRWVIVPNPILHN